jgi:hypothetical protein
MACYARYSAVIVCRTAPHSSWPGVRLPRSGEVGTRRPSSSSWPGVRPGHPGGGEIWSSAGVRRELDGRFSASSRLRLGYAEARRPGHDETGSGRAFLLPSRHYRAFACLGGAEGEVGTRRLSSSSWPGVRPGHPGGGEIWISAGVRRELDGRFSASPRLRRGASARP